MKSMRLYDEKSAQSILEHARFMLGKSLRYLYGDIIDHNGGKGSLGQSVERYHFQYSPNSFSEPDFPMAGVELKCTPLKRTTDGSMVSKERLVLNIIDYEKEALQNFDNSSFWHKNSLLLLMFYLHEKGIDAVDFIFKIVRLWQFPEEDLKIIRDDWEKIHKKILSGLAHEISEGDTFYLGACIKGSKGGANKRKQYNSDILADQRAYAIKSQYVNTIILDSLLHPEMTDEVFLSDKQKARISSIIKQSSNIVKSVSEYDRDETFEDLVQRRFSLFYGKTIYEIEHILGVKITDNPKAISNNVIHAILGVKTPKIKEFEKAGIQQKSIRLEPNGTLKESMVFSQINYDSLVKETRWEDSVWFNTLTQRFLLIVFRKNEDGNPKNAVLEKVFFWNMPSKDLNVAKDFWTDTRDKVRKGIFNDFITISDNMICHVRPKARNSADKVMTQYGWQDKKGYWLNRDYILDIVNSNI